MVRGNKMWVTSARGANRDENGESCNKNRRKRKREKPVVKIGNQDIATPKLFSG